ncbi:formylglycine-generating enzyme family protein [Lysinibacter cavernae]|uniref:Formylglycine-generating enzyme required for sulfatase activity n=1 Tax=Lysinibacter cavernae TaxID=1640652 RepID=A0A7X5QYZ7_9MICO|nr:SUMF1/EgtB/PvdO family nonheme iron enzyme [Lysinibacter cavernae]NIH52604.1 formylglycine-generating enzyme required for sulfatase activity [Lysinibacter cavernae]
MTSDERRPAPATGGFVHVGGGSIRQRDARTESTVEVCLAPFAISVSPVTISQFAAHRLSDGHELLPADQAGSIPAHGVTWFDAVIWCNAASRLAGLTEAYLVDDHGVEWRVEANGFRLPTEAEWEFACRAGTSAPTYGALHEIGWTAADAVDGPQPVGLKQPNAFGLVDTIGNVWEWCWNYADTARYADYRSLRGGGWADKSWSCRASVRRGSAPNAVIEDVGFRVVSGTIGSHGKRAAQGWSDESDRERAHVVGPRPIGWTPLQFRDEPSKS